MDYNNAQMDH